MMWNHAKLILFLDELNVVTNQMADEIKTIKDKMPGHGVSPAEAGIVVSRLNDVESKLRQIAANKDAPLPEK